MINSLKHLEKAIETVDSIKGEETLSYFCRDDIIPAMEKVRYHVDHLESMVDYREWPLPNYSSMFFNQS